MQTVTVPAIKDFEFEGRRVQPGDGVTLSAAQAAALHRQGLVSLDASARLEAKVETPAPDLPVVEPEPDAPVRRRRTYRRKDLRAEAE